MCFIIALVFGWRFWLPQGNAQHDSVRRLIIPGQRWQMTGGAGYPASTRRNMSPICPIWSSVTISGGDMARLSPIGRQETPASQSFSKAARPRAPTVSSLSSWTAPTSPHVPDIDDTGQIGEAVQHVFPSPGHRIRVFEDAFVTVEVRCGDCCGAGQRMARIGIAVEQVGHGRWPAQECLPHGAGGEDTAQRHRGIGDPFGGSHQVGFYPELLVGKGRSQPPKAGNHLIKNQQDAMAVTDVAQPLQVALRRREYAPAPATGSTMQAATVWPPYV